MDKRRDNQMTKRKHLLNSNLYNISRIEICILLNHFEIY